MSKYASLVPALSDDDYQALKADIAAVGVQIAVEYDEDGEILDGFHRVRACDELGIKEWPRITRFELTEEEKRAHARRLNLARRHLNTAQKRSLIEAQLKETPETSDRQIANSLGVAQQTVSTARHQLEDCGQLTKLVSSKGADGKTRPRKRKSYRIEDNSPEGEDSIVDSADQIIGKKIREQIAAEEANAIVPTKIMRPEREPDLITEPPQFLRTVSGAPISKDTLWLWGLLRDFETKQIDPAKVFANVTTTMQDDFARTVPKMRAWLEQLEEIINAERTQDTQGSNGRTAWSDPNDHHEGTKLTPRH